MLENPIKSQYRQIPCHIRFGTAHDKAVDFLLRGAGVVAAPLDPSATGVGNCTVGSQCRLYAIATGTWWEPGGRLPSILVYIVTRACPFSSKIDKLVRIELSLH